MNKAEAKRIANSIAVDVLRREAGAGVIALEAERLALSDKDWQLLQDVFRELIEKLESAGKNEAKA